MFNYTTGLLGLSWALGAIVVAVMCIRLWTKVFVIRQPGWDDALMGLASACALTCSALVTVATKAGLGTHIGQITNPLDTVIAIKYTFIAPTFSIIAAIFGKVSIIVFMFRLMGVAAHKWHLYLLCVMCTIMVGLNFFAVIVMLGYCRPAEAIWDKTVDGVCWSPRLLLFAGEASTVYNAVMDVVITIIPIAALTKLHIQRSMKISLCIMMGAGLFATVATICKSYAMRGITDAVDITFAWAPITMWYTAEMDAIIIFGSLPALLPAWRHARDWSTNHSSGNTGSKRSNPIDSASGGSRPIRLDSQRREKKQVHGMATQALFSIDRADSQMELTRTKSLAENSA